MCFQSFQPLNREYAAVCALIRRSGLKDLSSLPKYLSAKRYNHTPSDDPKKPGKDDDDDGKISSLLAKAFLWMLSAYMVIAIISLMFPNSNQPEVYSRLIAKSFIIVNLSGY